MIITDILIVEDNREIGTLLPDFLVQDGFSAVLYETGEEALEAFKKDGAKLVVLDVILPGMDGFAFCQAVRKEYNTPLIIVSARNEKEDKLNGLLLGADDYIEKPYDIDILLAKIHGIFQRRYQQSVISLGPLKLEVNRGEFYLSEVKKEIESYYAEKLQLLKIPFEMDFGPDCLLKGDLERTVEVFQNLMENAVKYGNGSKISISHVEQSDSRIIAVSNGNIFIGEAELPHLFDSFYRGSNGKNIQGNGLGLYIRRKILQAMDGEIHVKYEKEVFTVYVILRKL